MEETDASIGARARAIRKARKMTLKNVAAEAGFHFSYIAALERGERRWSIAVLEQVAAVLGVSSHLLVDHDIPLDRFEEVSGIIERLPSLSGEQLKALGLLLDTMK